MTGTQRPTPSPDEDFVETRIQANLDALDDDQRAGLQEVDDALQEAGVDHATRLTTISAIRHLGRISEETLDTRVERSGDI